MKMLCGTILAAVAMFSAYGAFDMRDFGSLCHIAAVDSSAADKARAYVVCDGRTDTAVINAVIAQMAAARGGKLVFFPGNYIVDSWTAFTRARGGFLV